MSLLTVMYKIQWTYTRLNYVHCILATKGEYKGYITEVSITATMRILGIVA